MSDIVERLRSICQPSAPYSSQDILNVMREAADEIKLLQGIEEVAREITKIYETEIERLRAQNAELLTALERVNRTTSAGTRTLDDFIRDMRWANDTARAAIAKAEKP
jgi:hypothetical protein